MRKTYTWLYCHGSHWFHGVCLFIANLASHAGHGHTPWG